MFCELAFQQAKRTTGRTDKVNLKVIAPRPPQGITMLDTQKMRGTKYDASLHTMIALNRCSLSLFYRIFIFSPLITERGLSAMDGTGC